MLYIKIYDSNGLISTEAHIDPIYVRKQSNNVVVICSESQSQGVVSLDGNAIYQLTDKLILDPGLMVAYPITLAEYLNLSEKSDDDLGDLEEPTDNEATDDTSHNMTKSEMIERILSLEDELAATKILLGVQ